MANELTPIQQASRSILSMEKEFNALNTEKLVFKKECEFALQLLEGNETLLKASIANPSSLKNAIVNVSAIGLSLNPAEKLAYLVPRGGKVCLDDSYMGKIKLATDSGSIRWAKVELIYKNDTFKENGIGQVPVHEFNRFEDRGEIVGVYCVAKTFDGELLVEVMTRKECHEIRNKTEAYKAFKDGKIKSTPWNDNEPEMIKKTVVRRAFKFWPKTKRVLKAMEIELQNNGLSNDFTRDESPAEKSAIEEIRSIIEQKPDWEKRILDHMTKKTNGKITFKSIEDFKKDEAEYALHTLQEALAAETTVQAGEQ